MRFSSTMEQLGVSLVSSVMTLMAFLPVLFKIGAGITELPIIGHVPHALVWAALFWSIFGTVFLALVGIRLPGLAFRNQRVEAAYRKELVYGEDDPDRAQPPTVAELFNNVRKNYFRLYFNYMYFNVARIFYLQADNLFSLLVLVPSIVAGKLTLGLLTQITNVFDQVRSSFQYLVNSWTTIVELLSIYKRLRTFESALGHKPLPSIDLEYLAEGKSAPARHRGVATHHMLSIWMLRNWPLAPREGDPVLTSSLEEAKHRGLRRAISPGRRAPAPETHSSGGTGQRQLCSSAGHCCGSMLA